MRAGKGGAYGHGSVFFETMLDNIHEAIYILDKNRRFVFMNRAFFEIVSSTRGELMQHDVYELRDKGFFNLCLSDMVFEQQREVTIYQESVGGHNGRQLHINTCTPIFNENGKSNTMWPSPCPLQYSTKSTAGQTKTPTAGSWSSNRAASATAGRSSRKARSSRRSWTAHTGSPIPMPRF